MAFLADGQSRYYPRFARADRHTPIGLRAAALRVAGQDLALAAGPALPAGPARVERAVLSRAAPGAQPLLREVWDLRADEVEFSFVLERCPAPGELELALEVATEMRLEAPAGSGRLLWSADGLGAVACGDAVVRDADGKQLPIPITWQEGRLRLRVPGAFAAAARWPLVIDPVLSTFAIETGPADPTRPRVAYDPTFRVWLVVALLGFNTIDHDLVVYRLDESGTLLDTTFLDLTLADMGSADVADNGANGQFLLAWVDETSHRILRRTRAPGNTSYGPLVVHRQLPALFPGHVALGGAAVGDTYLMIETFAQVPVDFVTATVVHVDGSTPASAPLTAVAVGSPQECAVSTLRNQASNWGVALANNLGVQFTAVAFAGGAATATPVVTVQPPSPGLRRVSIAGSGDEFVMAWQEGALGARVHAAAWARDTQGTYGESHRGNLTILERGGAVGGGDFRDPWVAFDGCRYAYGYVDNNGFPRAATFRTVSDALGARFVFDDVLANLAGSNLAAFDTVLAAEGATGGGVARCLAVWYDRAQSSPLTLRGARYDARQPGAFFQSLATACGAPSQILLSASGAASLCASFTVTAARAVGTSLLLTGLPALTPLPICPASNAACLLGVQLPVLAAVVSTTITVQVPDDASLLGATIAFQAIDLGGPGGCPASAVGLDLRLSDTVLATVR